MVHGLGCRNYGAEFMIQQQFFGSEFRVADLGVGIWVQGFVSSVFGFRGSD